jgi:prenyltransferase beta subunit
MRKRQVVLVCAGAFLASLVLSVLLVQAFNGVFTETRRSVLTTALENCQPTGNNTFIQSSDILSSLRILGVQDRVAIDAALRLVSSKQDPIKGGYDIFYGHDGIPLGDDLGSTYYAVDALKAFNGLDWINQTLLIDFVMKRYNSSSGAFHELETEAFNRTFAMCNFPMEFGGGWGEIAFATPNVIDTFFGVSILKDMNALGLINITRTLDWVISDQSESGGFQPYPYNPANYWGPPDPFPVDDVECGIPYTFAAAGILKAFGATNLMNKEKARDYILSCQSADGGFMLYRSGEFYEDYEDFFYTYNAVLALGYLGMVNETSEAVTKVNNMVLGSQVLGLYNYWLMPTPHDAYGFLSDPDQGYTGGTWEGLEILNATGGLSLLNQPTPRAFVSLVNLVELSALISILSLVVLFMISKARRSIASKKGGMGSSDSAIGRKDLQLAQIITFNVKWE